MNVMKLVKLLYLADRQVLVQWGRPISFDWYFSLPHGPVLSFTLDCINAQRDPENPGYWHRFISERQGHDVRLIGEVQADQLSEAEEAALDAVFKKFGFMDQFQLRDWCHEHLPEWRDPHGSRLPIDIGDILRAEGYNDDDVQEVMEGLATEAHASRLLH